MRLGAAATERRASVFSTLSDEPLNVGAHADICNRAVATLSPRDTRG